MASARNRVVKASPSASRALARGARRTGLGALAAACALVVVDASAQQPTGGAAGAMPPELMRQMESIGGPTGDAMARLKRMNDPNAGKRPGDNALSCEQMKAELAETKRKYDEQAARYDAMVESKKASTERYVQATTGVAAQAGQLARGAVVAATVGAFGTDAMREAAGKAAIAPELAMRQQQIDEGNQLNDVGEVKHGYYQRGVALVALGRARGCQGVSLAQ